MNTADVLHHGWDEDAVRERDGLDETSDTVPASSSFTAINHHQSAFVNTQPSSPVQQSQDRRSTSSTRHRRNPIVAHYLGLGYSEEPSHLEKYAPLPDGPRSPPPKPAKKQRKLRNVDDTMHSANAHSKVGNATRQGRVSEGLSVTKLLTSHATLRTSRTVQASEGSKSAASTVAASNVPSSTTTKAQDDCMRTTSPITIHNSSDVIPNPQLADSDFTSDDVVDSDFDDDLDDEEFLKLTSDTINTGGSVCNLSSSPFESDLMQGVKRDDQSLASSINLSEENLTRHDVKKKKKKKKFFSPITLTTRLLAATGDVDCAEARKPIVRSPFPVTVRDRSPIIGLSSNTVLRTCFRIGEAINQAHQSSRSGKHIVFELYARILESERVEAKQLFTFCDLFHGKPPYIKATYEAALWRSAQLFDYDSKRLLQQGRICRCMGTMKRDGKEWVMIVMNIWQATWEDIKWVEGIVNF